MISMLAQAGHGQAMAELIYFSNLLDDHKNNLKQTWKILNGLLGRVHKKSFPDCFNINGTVTSDSTIIANGFNHFFINIGPRLSNNIPVMNVLPNHFLSNIPSPPNSLFFRPTDYEEVHKLCASLKAGIVVRALDMMT